MKRVICCLLVFSLFWAMQVEVFAYKGYRELGDYSNSNVRFGFMTEDTVVVYNKEAFVDTDFDEVWPGSDIYIPIGVLGASASQATIATDKQIKDNGVTVSYKVTANDKYINSVSIVNGKKAKISEIQSGNYVKIDLNESFTNMSVFTLDIKLVLSVNKISYPETQIRLYVHMVNRLVDIEENTVHPVMAPTKFYTDRYGGPAIFDFGDGIRYHTMVERRSEYYLNLDRSQDQIIMDMYPDAYLEFYNFVGDRDTFANIGTLEIPITRSNFTPRRSKTQQVFAYEVVGNILIAMDDNVISFDSSKNKLNIHTQTLGEYVLSNLPLHTLVDTEDEILYTGYAVGGGVDTSRTGNANTASTPSGGSGGDDIDDDTGSTGIEYTTSGTPYTNNINPNAININTDNTSTDNPATADTFHPVIPAVLGSLALGACLFLRLSGAKRSGSK